VKATWAGGAVGRRIRRDCQHSGENLSTNTVSVQMGSEGTAFIEKVLGREWE